MSSQPYMQPTEPTQTPSPQPPTRGLTISVRNAPQTFDPHNTDPTPEMFSDKWASEQ